MPVQQIATWSPYCGAAPAPGDLVQRWNLDPWLLAAVALLVAGYVVHRRRGGEGRDGLVAMGGLLLVVSFVSPLCAASSALFSARAAHHALLVAAAAPLLAFGLPRRAIPALPLAPAVALHAAALWLWHAPGLYAWALSNDLAYWLMQASLLGTALAFWSAVRRAGVLAGAAGLFVTMMQTGLLGALLTFAAEPLYAPHLASTWAFGLSPLADQQLAGLIMWAPMAGAYLLAALALVGRSLSPVRVAPA